MSQDLLHLLKAQRRQRRLAFWLGFAGILLLGGLWAQLSKDPIVPDFANDFVVEAEEEMEFFPDEPVFEPVPTTIAELAPEPIDTTIPETTTTVEP